MRIEAAVHEWTGALAPVEVLAWDLGHSILVLFHQFILVRSPSDHDIRGDDQVAVPPADGARPVVVLDRVLRVGGSPLADAVQTEHVRTVLQDAELTPLGQDLLQTDHALVVILHLLLLLLLARLLVLPGRLGLLGMQVLAVVSEPTVALLEVLAGCELVAVLVEEVNDVLIIHHLARGDAAQQVVPDHLLDPQLPGHRIIGQDHALLHIRLLQMVLIQSLSLQHDLGPVLIIEHLVSVPLAHHGHHLVLSHLLHQLLQQHHLLRIPHRHRHALPSVQTQLSE